MRISAKRANLGKIMISRKKPISRVKKIIKNKTNKRKTKKIKKKHKKVKHKTTRKNRSMSRIGRRRTYHGGATFPMNTKDNTIGRGSYGVVYIPDPGKPSWVAKLHKIENHEIGCKLTGEYKKHEQAFELLEKCKNDFKDIKLKIPGLQEFHYLTRSSTNLKEYETTDQQQEGVSGCVYTMERIWPPSQKRIEKLIKKGIKIYQRDNGPPSYLFLSWNRYWPEKSNTVIEISMLKNSYFNSPSHDSQIIEDKKIGFIELFDGSPAFNWGYSMMLFYFYCAYNNLILRDSEFALGQDQTGRQNIHLFCYDFNQCRPSYDDKDTAKQYLHLSGMKIGHSKYGSQEEAESDNWKFMPIPTTSPKFFVDLVNTIIQDAEKAYKPSEFHKFHIYIKKIVDLILLWLMKVQDGENWKKHSSFPQPLSDVLNKNISDLFKKHNIHNYHYYSIRDYEYNQLPEDHALKNAVVWTKDTDNQEGVFRINKDDMNEYIKARKMKCLFGLDNLATNSIELELRKIQPKNFYFCSSKPIQISAAQRRKWCEYTFLVNINLDIEMQKTIIKKMVIDGFITSKYILTESVLDSFFSRLLNFEREAGFYKIIEMLDKEYITMKQKANDEENKKDENEEKMPENFQAPFDDY